MREMKYSSLSAMRSSSATELAIGTPGDWGSWQTPMKFFGNRPRPQDLKVDSLT